MKELLKPEIFNDQSHAHPSHVGNAVANHMLSSYSIVTAVALLFMLLFSPSQAFAATTQNRILSKAAVPLSWSCGDFTSNHCYGIQFWGGAAGSDTRITLNTSLSGGGTNNDYYAESFVTTEMWLQDSLVANPKYWVEVGVISEYTYFYTTYPYYYWADQRPNGGGYSFHYFTSIPSATQSPLFRINQIDSSDWNVLIRDNSNTYTATSTANNFTPAAIVVGTELYNNYQTAHEPTIQYSNNRWFNNGTWSYQTNDGKATKIKSPVSAGWYNGQDPLHNSTGGIWFSCILGYGC